MDDTARTPAPLVVSLAGLTAVSGFLDAVSYLALGHVFTANMTGNVLLLGFAAAGAAGFSFAASLCALAFFLAGAVVGGMLARRVPEPRSLVLAAMAVETALTVAAALIAALVVGVGSGWPRFVVIALLALAVGTRNAAVRRLAVPDMSTTVLTTTLTGLASESSLAGGTNPHLRNRSTSVIAMFAGAVVGAVLVAARRCCLVPDRRRRSRRGLGGLLLAPVPAAARSGHLARAGPADPAGRTSVLEVDRRGSTQGGADPASERSTQELERLGRRWPAGTPRALRPGVRSSPASRRPGSRSRRESASRRVWPAWGGGSPRRRVARCRRGAPLLRGPRGGRPPTATPRPPP